MKNVSLVLEDTFGMKKDHVNDARRIIFVLLELELNSLLKHMEETSFQKITISSLKLWRLEKKKVMIQQQLLQSSLEFS